MTTRSPIRETLSFKSLVDLTSQNKAGVIISGISEMAIHEEFNFPALSVVTHPRSIMHLTKLEPSQKEMAKFAIQKSSLL